MSVIVKDQTVAANVIPKHIAHRLPEFENGDSANQFAPKTADIKIDELNVDFSSLLLSERLLEGLHAAGFKYPSPIQLKAIPIGRCGLDMVVQAKAGTGKTCVFAVLALETVVVSNPSTQVIIIAPTREIANQIYTTVASIGFYMVAQTGADHATSKDRIKVGCFIGGTALKDDREKMKQCQIVIGTPGRIWQLVTEGDLSLGAVRLFVMDEADKLMEESYIENINSVYATLPSSKQLVVLSATYPRQLDEFLSRYMKSPRFVKLDTSDLQLLGIKQYIWTIEVERQATSNWLTKKTEFLHRLLSRLSFKQCLVFCNYQDKAEALCKQLCTIYKWPAEFIAANLKQPQRLVVMENLKNFKIRVLVSTDLTARGIDAENVNLVVNFEVPQNAETYFHRIGRAGRFGGYGAAITILSRRMDEFEYFSLAADHNLRVKRLNLEDAPHDLVDNEEYFERLPILKMPDKATLQKEAEKREAYYRLKQQKYKEEHDPEFAKTLAKERIAYSEIMTKHDAPTRHDPVHFVWTSSVYQPVRRNPDEKTCYTRRQLLDVLADTLSGKVTYATAVDAKTTATEQLPVPKTDLDCTSIATTNGNVLSADSLSHTDEPTKEPVKVSIPTQSSSVKAVPKFELLNKLLAASSTSSYFPSECLQDELDIDRRYAERTLFGSAEDSDGDSLSTNASAMMFKYTKDEMLSLRRNADVEFARRCILYHPKPCSRKQLEIMRQMMSDDANVEVAAPISDKTGLVTGDSSDKAAGEMSAACSKSATCSKSAGETCIATKSSQQIKQEVTATSKDLERQFGSNPPLLTAEELRQQYVHAVQQASLSPLCQLLAGWTVNLQAASYLPQRQETSSVATMSCQTDETRHAKDCARRNVSYGRDQMLAVWRTVANNDWAPSVRHFDWLETVKQCDLLVERQFQTAETVETNHLPEQSVRYDGDEEVQEEQDGQEQEDDEENAYDGALDEWTATQQDYRRMLNMYTELMKDYQLLLRKANSSSNHTRSRARGRFD